MDNSKQYLKNHQIHPRISFKDGQSHTLKLLKDKPVKITTQTGEIVDGVRYLVEENEDVKTFQTASETLIQRLAEIPENEVVTIQMKRRKTEKGYRSYFEVVKLSEVFKEPSEISDDEIPVIEPEKNETEPDIFETKEPPTHQDLSSPEPFQPF